MKGRTTEQIADDCACWCRQVPSEVWCLDDQRRCSQRRGHEVQRVTRRVDRSETGRRNESTEAGTEAKTQETYILTKFSERNTDRQGSSSVEVEKMKIERSEAEGTHMADRETISKLLAVAPLRTQSGGRMTQGQNRGVGGQS